MDSEASEARSRTTDERGKKMWQQGEHLGILMMAWRPHVGHNNVLPQCQSTSRCLNASVQDKRVLLRCLARGLYFGEEKKFVLYGPRIKEAMKRQWFELRK